MLILLLAILIYILNRLNIGANKHGAVRNAFLAKYTYNKMNDTLKKQINDKTVEIMRRCGLIDKDIIGMSEMLKYCFCAFAMAELNIPPALPDERWQYVKNPYLTLKISEHPIQVVKFHLEKKHNVKINLVWKDDLAIHKLIKGDQLWASSPTTEN